MKKILFILTFVLFYGLGYSQDLVPENTGYGYERLTTAQLNALPKKKVGDIYYNNDLGYHVKWNGTIFQSLASGVSGIDPADQDKLNNISITQPVNLDTVESLANSALQTETDPTTTPANLKSKLESLTAENRLDASAIKNLPTGDVISVNGQTGVVTLTKGDVDLGNVDNTSDLNKPISTATQAVLDNKINVNPVSPTQWISIAGGTQAELDAADILGNTPVGGITYAFPTDLSATTDGMIEDFSMAIVGADTLQFTANYPSPMPDIIRKVKLPSGGSGVTDHGALTGLADDDHTQYYNQTRGDARYLRTEVDGSVTNEIQTLSLSGNTVSLTSGGSIDVSTTTAVSANTAKVSNATHTGDVAGSTALTIANNAVTSAKIADGTIGLADLSATGTRNATTILYGDNTWKTAPSGGGADNLGNHTATTTLNMSSQNITNANLIQGTTLTVQNATVTNAPTSGQDVVNKTYVDGFFSSGTFTPIFNNSLTFTIVTSSYYKVGKMVSFSITLSNISGTVNSSLNLTGLPFNAANRTYFNCVLHNDSDPIISVVAEMTGGVIGFRRNFEQGTAIPWDVGYGGNITFNGNANDTLKISGTYFTN